MPRKSTKRNAQGNGSIRQRKDGTWEARYTLGRDPGTGKQLQKSIYGATQKEVREKLQKISVEISEGTHVEPSKMPVSEWLDIWLSEYTANVKPNTIVTYRVQVKHHIKPFIGRVSLSALRPHQIQTMYNRLGAGDETNKPLSPKSIKNVHGVLHRALDQAVLLSYIAKNPCIGVRLPRIERAVMHPLDDDQIKKYLDLSKSNTYGDLFFVTLFTGMRQSEVMGLTWSCVDFERGTIYVDRQLVYEKKKGGAYVFAPPKNDIPRTITPAPMVMQRLKIVRGKQLKAKLSAGPAWKNEMDLVFTDAWGHHYAHNTLSHNCKRLATQIGVPEFRFHDLRHTYAVASLRAGDDIKTVQQNLGHATAAFTLDRYAHVTDQMRCESAQRMDSFIQRLTSS